MTANNRTVSGMRPTGPLHIGHYFGALKNWIDMQNDYEAFFFVADWHALTSNYADTSKLPQYVRDMVVDWMSAGLDPEKCAIYRQSDIRETAELHLLLSMITPLGWLERCPTYKEQQQNITDKDLGNYGFLGYPVLMTADIIQHRPHWVPVGQDQQPHLELAREIVRRFNGMYDTQVFPEPEARLTPAAKCPGLDGRKMSKRLKNYPDPMDVVNKYGADALRLFMLGSQVVRAEDLKFSEEGIKEVLRNVMIPMWNAYSFFVTYANVDGYECKDAVVQRPQNLSNALDRWIISSWIRS
mgnify:CR=1 FL=1